MQIYTFSSAPNPQRLGYYLKYKNIEIPTTEISLTDNEHFSDEFKAINPDSTLPSLQLDDGTVLTDTIAICVYLEKLYPEKPLFGSNDIEYAQVIGWDHKIFMDGFTAVAEMLRNHSKFFIDRAVPGKVNVPQLDALVGRGKLRLDAFWEDLDENLQDKSFLVAEQFTFADIDAFVICSFAGWVKEKVPDHCHNILRWQQAVEKLL